MAVLMMTVDGIDYEVAPKDPPRSDRPASDWWAITPDVAASWLKSNQRNRSLRGRAADAQGRDMSTQDWDVNGESIILSRPLLAGEVEDVPAGTVLLNDGQHRLEACASSGATFVSLVAYGVSPDTQRTVDSGIVRTMTDVLNMDGETFSPVLSSLLRRQLMWDTGERRFNGNALKVTKAECLRYLEKDPHGFRQAAQMGTWVRTGFRFIPPSVAAQGYYLTHAISPDQAPWFFARVHDGAELPVRHPVLALRNRFQNDRLNKKAAPAHQQLGYVIRAWNAYREDRTLTSIIQDVNDPVVSPI